MKQETKMLTALFLTSALNDTLDELQDSNQFVREFKRETKRYLKFIERKVHGEIDRTYKTDPETFEHVQGVIDSRAIQLSNEIITAFQDALKQ